MDCGTVSHLIARLGCHLGNTTVDETLGLVGLVIIGVEVGCAGPHVGH